MALIFTEGFDTYGSGSATSHSPTNVMNRRGWTGAQLKRSETARVSGWAYSAAVNYTDRMNLSNTEAIKTIGLAFKVVNNDYRGNYIIGMHDSTTAQMNIYLNSSGFLEVRRGASTVLDTGTTTIDVNTWYYVELKTTIHNTTGAYELMIDGVSEVSDTGVDTQETGNAYWDSVALLTAGFGAPYLIHIDDMYVTDSTGANNTGFLGVIQIETIRPTSDVTTDWTALGAGSHYVEVDENPIDDDTSYVESGTPADRELFGMGDTAAGTPTIFGITSIVDARNTDATTHDIQLVNKSSTTTTVSSPQTVGSTSAAKFEEITELNPDTSTAWTKTTIDAAEFGFEVA